MAGVANERQQLRAIAYHEAGHAVAGFTVRRPVEHVTIIPEEDSLGHVLYRPFQDFHPDRACDKKTLQRIEDTVFCLLAGYAAEWKHAGKPNDRAASSDFHYAISLADHTHGSNRAVTTYFAYQMACVRDFMDLPSNWAAVKAIAAALLTHRRLSGRAARKLAVDAGWWAPR
jgi:hypothetical protein